MLRVLTADQRQLANFMSNLSEQAYCAGWIEGLEYALWEAPLNLALALGNNLGTIAPKHQGVVPDCFLRV